GARNDVELIVSTDPEPDVPAVFKRLGYPLQAKHLFVELRTLLQITHVYGGVIKLRLAGRPRLGMGQGRYKSGH
ncbi:MAG TPA: hypothetical protein VNX88_17085, partial [Terriglobales bacterium]|nr:hypothetical protein [Terriglobales bacterium]